MTLPTGDGNYVSEVDASATASPGFLSARQQDGRAYHHFNIRQHFATHSGLMQLPTGGPVGTSARIVRVHAPYSTKVITWVVMAHCLVGEKPILPHWDTLDPNEVYILGEVRVEAPAIRALGEVFLWRVSGEYHYASGYAGRGIMSGGSSAATTLPPESFGLTEGDFSKDFLRSVAGGIKGGSVFNGLVFDSALV